MITLYHCVDARSFRALWSLEEAGVPYKLEMLPFPPRWKAREFLEINPLGTIPFFIDGAVTMTESSAISQYVAEKYAGAPFAVRPDEPAYGAYLNALHFGEATLTFPQTIVLRYGKLEPPERRLPQAVADYSKWALARAGQLDRWLDGRDYVVADRFTAADISVGYALLLARATGLYEKMSPTAHAYFDRLRERPAFKRAGAAQKKAAEEKGIALELPSAVSTKS